MGEVKHSGIDFSGLLFLLFLGLKLGGVIDWSWWFVFAPLWIPIVLFLLVLFLFLVGYGIIKVFQFLIELWRNKQVNKEVEEILREGKIE